MTPTVSVVVVGFGPEPGLGECLRAVVADAGPAGEVVLVDNGIEAPPPVAGVTIVHTSRNLGFAGGARVGVERSSGEVLVFVNSDAVIASGTIDALTQELQEPSVGMVCGCVVLADEPALVNSAGNPVHVTGISWAGGLHDPVAQHQAPCDVASVTGALFAMRREVWTQLGGLDPSFFMYYEDADLSLRCWLAGLRVTYCPGAVARHSYDFGRNPRKMYLLERNRLTTVLSVYPRSLLLRALPVLLLSEPLLFLVAARDGWFRERVDAWSWVVRNVPAVRRRRRATTARVVDPGGLDHVLTSRLTQGQLRAPSGMNVLNAAVTRYWRAVTPRRDETTRPVLRRHP